MLQTIIEACFTSFSPMPKMTSGVGRCRLSCTPGRDIVEANDLIRRVSRGRNLYRMHQGQKPADLPVAQLTKFELTGLDSKRAGPRCSLAQCIAPAQVWNWHHPEMPETPDYFRLLTYCGL